MATKTGRSAKLLPARPGRRVKLGDSPDCCPAHPRAWSPSRHRHQTAFSFKSPRDLPVKKSQPFNRPYKA